jgi:hypothetical protein
MLVIFTSFNLGSKMVCLGPSELYHGRFCQFAVRLTVPPSGVHVEEGGHPIRQSLCTMVLFQAPSLLSVY